MQNMAPNDFEEAVHIVDRLAELADEDLELVAKAIRLHTIHSGRDLIVDLEAAERWIVRERDALEFDGGSIHG